jgi:hypothetical protein
MSKDEGQESESYIVDEQTVGTYPYQCPFCESVIEVSVVVAVVESPTEGRFLCTKMDNSEVWLHSFVEHPEVS